MKAFDVTFTRTRTITEEFTFSIAANDAGAAVDEAMERDFEDADESKVIERTGGDWFHQKTVAMPRSSYYSYADFYNQCTNNGRTPINEEQFYALVEATNCDPCHIYGIVESAFINISEGNTTFTDELDRIG